MSEGVEEKVLAARRILDDSSSLAGEQATANQSAGAAAAERVTRDKVTDDVSILGAPGAAAVGASGNRSGCPGKGTLVARATVIMRSRSLEDVFIPGVSEKMPISNEELQRDGSRKDVSICREKELIPPGETRTGFSGYLTFYHALAAAVQSDKVVAVGQDSTGAFRAFETNQKRPGAVIKGIELYPTEEPVGGLLNSRLVNLDAPVEFGQTWQTLYCKVAQAEGDELKLKECPDPLDEKISGGAGQAEIDQLYLSMLRRATGLDSTEAHAAAAYQEFLPGRVNLFRNSKFSGETVLLDRQANGQFAADPISLPKDKTSTLPVVAFAVSADPFLFETPAYLVSTLVHEATHAAILERSLDIVDAWRKTRNKDLNSWSRTQIGKTTAGKKLTNEDDQLIVNHLMLTEVLARVEAFTSMYHYPRYPFTPGHETKQSSNEKQEEKDADVLSDLHFKEISDINNYWPFIDQVEVDKSGKGKIGKDGKPVINSQIRQALLKRLKRYYTGLDSEHKAKLILYVKARIKNDGDLAPKIDFYKDLQSTLGK